MRTTIPISVFAVLVILLLGTSCQDSNRQKVSRELVPNPEKYEHDGYSTQPDSLRPVFIPDTAIGTISLVNSSNIDSFLGENTMSRLTDNGLPHSSVVSKGGDERLTFFFHPGNAANEFSEFEVSYVEQSNRDEFKVHQEEFSTESNVKLGMTMGDLRALKGEPDSIVNNETIVFQYRITEAMHSEFLKKYGMPTYYANYEFSNGYLVRFKFGFEYP